MKKAPLLNFMPPQFSLQSPPQIMLTAVFSKARSVSVAKRPARLPKRRYASGTRMFGLVLRPVGH